MVFSFWVVCWGKDGAEGQIRKNFEIAGSLSSVTAIVIPALGKGDCRQSLIQKMMQERATSFVFSNVRC